MTATDAPVRERDIAIAIADTILDRPYGDPDDDIAILARQFLRAQERIAAQDAARVADGERLEFAEFEWNRATELAQTLTAERDTLRADLAAALAVAGEAADILVDTFAQVSDPDNYAGWSDSDAYSIYRRARALATKPDGGTNE